MGRIVKELAELGMEKAMFTVSFSPAHEPGASGLDQIEFTAVVGYEAHGCGGLGDADAVDDKTTFVEMGPGAVLAFDLGSYERAAHVAGAIGVSGGSGEQDQTVAEAGAGAL